MKKLINYRLIKIIILLGFAITLGGCLETLKQKYNEGAAATKSLVDSTQDLISNSGNTSKSPQNQKTQSTTSNSQVASSSGSTSATRQKTSYELEGEAVEAKYDHITFKSPNPDIISSATYRSYNGYYVEPVKAWNRDIEEYLKPYYQLLMLKDNYKKFDKQRLKKIFDGNYSSGRSARAWDDAFMIEFITDFAIKTRAFKACEKELCTPDLIGKNNKEQACLSLCARQRIGWTMYGKSVFDKRRSFNAYLDNELDTAIALAKELKHETYVKGMAQVSNYQFKEGGFVLQGVSYMAGTSKILFESDKASSELPVFKDQKGYGENYGAIKGILYKMNADKAEIFTKKLKSDPKKKWANALWYVYKVRLELSKNGMFYKHIVTSPKIEFFFDETLKEKAFEIPVK